MRRVLVSLLAGVLAPLGALACVTSVIRVNVSPSLPYGLYRVHAVPAVLTVGTLVVVALPDWRPHPLLKPVAAIAGERICREGDRLLIRGQDYGVIHRTWEGQPLPSAMLPDTCAEVPAGHVFLATATPHSLDSRYYGPVAVKQMAATATPLLVWGTSHASTPVH